MKNENVWKMREYHDHVWLSLFILFFNQQKVYAIVVSHPMVGELSPAAVSYTAGFYHIPVIGISSRDSAFSDKVSNPSFHHGSPIDAELIK